MDPQNILAVVVAVDNEFYTLGTKEGVINQLYTRNQFTVCKEQLLSPEEDATDQSVSLRKASTSISQADSACQHSPVNVYI
ncbi:hypothetical protein QTP88_014464 [Uroleucon formosanum]